MTRKKNVFVKNKLKRNVCVLLGLFFILSVIAFHTTIQKFAVATTDEMTSCSTTLESIYKKLTPEEIKLLSKDGSDTLSFKIPNKLYGRVTISKDSYGIIGSFDYQESEVLSTSFGLAIFSTFLFGFLIICTIAILKKREI